VRNLGQTLGVLANSIVKECDKNRDEILKIVEKVALNDGL
jgi:hypothetical protein